MSDGLRDAFRHSIANNTSLTNKPWFDSKQNKDSDPIDLGDLDPWDDDEITEIVKDINAAYPSIPPQKPWLDFFNWKPPQIRRCECGAEVAKTTHVSWCPKFRS